MRQPADRARMTPARAAEAEVVPASGVYRTLIILLTVWTGFAGLALATQGVRGFTFDGANAAERMLGAYLLMLVPIYALIIWRPYEHRYLRWIPYAAQLAIIVPYLWDVLITTDQDFFDGPLMFVASSVFLGALVYVRSMTHPLGFFAEEEDEEETEDEEYEDEEEEEPLDEGDDEVEPARRGQTSSRGRRYRRN
jgi:hypothetical protein